MTNNLSIRQATSSDSLEKEYQSFYSNTKKLPPEVASSLAKALDAQFQIERGRLVKWTSSVRYDIFELTTALDFIPKRYPSIDEAVAEYARRAWNLTSKLRSDLFKKEPVVEEATTKSVKVA